MTEHDLQWIEKFYRGELKGAELQSFQQRMVEDAAFREEVDLHTRAMKAIKGYGREQFKKNLGERPLLHTPAKPWFRLGLAALIFSLLILLFFYLRPLQDKNAPEVVPSDFPVKVDSAGQLKTIPKGDDPVKHLSDPKPSAQNQQEMPKVMRNKLFAAAFQPHEDARTRDAAKRGINDTGSGAVSMQSFLTYYQKREYREALKVFGRLPEEVKLDGNNQFYYANALLAAGFTKQAQGIFEGLEQQGNSDFGIAAAWYAALAALKMGNVTVAKEKLTKLSTSNKGVYGTKAAQLLQDLSSK